MQATLQKMTGAITDVLRIVAMGKEGNPDAASEDVLARFMGLEDWEDWEEYSRDQAKGRSY